MSKKVILAVLVVSSLLLLFGTIAFAIFGYGSATTGASNLILNQLQSGSSSVHVYGNATVQEFTNQCGGAFYPVQVVFTSETSGTNYTASVTQSQQGPTGNYSIMLPGNDKYNVTINQRNGCAQSTSPPPPSCNAGTLTLGSNIVSEQANVQCGQVPTVVSSSSAITSSTTTASSSSTTVNTQASSTCQTS